MRGSSQKKRTELFFELGSKGVVGSKSVLIEGERKEEVPIISLAKPIEGVLNISPKKTELIDKVDISFVGYLDLLKDVANSRELMRTTITVTTITKIEEGKTHRIPFSFKGVEIPYESFFGQVAQIRYYLQAQIIRKKPKYEVIKNLYVLKNGTTPVKEDPSDAKGKKPKKEGPISEEVSCQDKSLHINIRVSSNVIHLSPEKPKGCETAEVKDTNPPQVAKKPGVELEGKEGDVVQEDKETPSSHTPSKLLKGSVTFFVVRNRLKNMVVSLIREEDSVCLSGDKFPVVIHASEIMEGTPKTELATLACGVNSHLAPKNLTIPFFINTASLDITPSFKVDGLLTVRYMLAVDIFYSEKSTNHWSFPITVLRD